MLLSFPVTTADGSRHSALAERSAGSPPDGFNAGQSPPPQQGPPAAKPHPCTLRFRRAALDGREPRAKLEDVKLERLGDRGLKFPRPLGWEAGGAGQVARPGITGCRQQV